MGLALNSDEVQRNLALVPAADNVSVCVCVSKQSVHSNQHTSWSCGQLRCVQLHLQTVSSFSSADSAHRPIVCVGVVPAAPSPPLTSHIVASQLPRCLLTSF